MRAITTTIEAYQFYELSESGKEKAIESCYDLNVDFEWWEQVYEDAGQAGIKITAFDIDRGSYCELDFIDSGAEVAHYIIDNHGEMCDTHQTAKEYLTKRDETVKAAPLDENMDFVDQWELDQELDELREDFKKAIAEEYLSILRQEYEYLTSEAAIIETIEANEYEFTAEGDLV